MSKWFVIENITIYVIVAGGIVWSRTGWPLLLLVFVNTSISKQSNKTEDK